jgi:hypothetical protein
MRDLTDAIVRLLNEASSVDVQLNGLFCALLALGRTSGISPSKLTHAALVYFSVNALGPGEILEGFYDFLVTRAERFDDKGAQALLHVLDKAAAEAEAQINSALLARSRARRSARVNPRRPRPRR